MHILITTEFYYPYAGGSIFLQQVAEGLAKKGHSVTVATGYLAQRTEEVVNGVTIKQFRVAGNKVKGMTGEVEAYKNFLLSSDCDVMINFAANIWTTDLVFEIMDTLKAKTILTTPGMSKINNSKYKEYYEEDYLSALKKYDALVYTSAHYHDKKFGDEHGMGSKAVIIPNGAGDEFLSPPRNFKKRYDITTKHMAVCVSNHYIAKGHWFVIKAFQKLARRDTTLVIIGNRPGAHGWYSCYPLCKLMSLGPRIKTLSGLPREDVVSAFAEADLFLFGSKIECSPLVMYEALVAKTPFITTDVGNVKDNAPPVIVVRSVLEMAAKANQLLDNPAERKRLGEDGFKLWQENYTWDKIVNQYEELCKRLTSNL